MTLYNLLVLLVLFLYFSTQIISSVIFQSEDLFQHFLKTSVVCILDFITLNISICQHQFSFFSKYRIVGYFFFFHFKYVIPLSYMSIASIDKLGKNYTFIPHYIIYCTLIPSVFTILFSSLIFRTLNMMCYGWLYLYLSCLGFAKISVSV